MIKAEIVADSLSPQGNRLISVLATFPRIILAEAKTHRILSKLDEDEGIIEQQISIGVNDTPELSKNTSSSRAIPFNKMLKEVIENPFIPIAWQKNHSGMQGTEYHLEEEKFGVYEFVNKLETILKSMKDVNSKEYIKLEKSIKEKCELINLLLSDHFGEELTLKEWWLYARDKAVEAASIMYIFDVSKQLCNRLLEPFMWTTMLITGTLEGGWDNFFELRCPQYEYKFGEEVLYFKSEKKLAEIKSIHKPLSLLDKLRINKGQAEIHMMDLAEKIYDAVNESTPNPLEAGEWHIPFKDKIKIPMGDLVKRWRDEGFTSSVPSMEYMDEQFVKVSTAMSARTSYTVVGDELEVDYEKMIALHDRLIAQNPPHSSPMEHCARAMTNHEYNHNVKGKSQGYVNGDGEPFLEMEDEAKGWCRNFKGFIPYRHIIENGQN